MPAAIHAQFIAHAVLIALMLIATFIDFDEKTIPDWITIPGTLLGLLFAAVWPTTLSTVLALPVALLAGLVSVTLVGRRSSRALREQLQTQAHLHAALAETSAAKR